MALGKGEWIAKGPGCRKVGTFGEDIVGFAIVIVDSADDTALVKLSAFTSGLHFSLGMKCFQGKASINLKQSNLI